MSTKPEIDAAITAAFRQVFGIEGSRDLAQQVVVARLREFARDGRPLFSPLESDRVLAMREGRAELWLEIKRRTTISPPSSLLELLGVVADTNGEDSHDD